MPRGWQQPGLTAGERASGDRSPCCLSTRALRLTKDRSRLDALGQCRQGDVIVLAEACEQAGAGTVHGDAGLQHDSLAEVGNLTDDVARRLLQRPEDGGIRVAGTGGRWIHGGKSSGGHTGLDHHAHH